MHHFDSHCLFAVCQSDAALYAKFIAEYELFLKEGVCTDFYHKDSIAKLLRYESSKEDAGKTVRGHTQCHIDTSPACGANVKPPRTAFVRSRWTSTSRACTRVRRVRGSRAGAELLRCGLTLEACTAIYFLIAPNRDYALRSPYFEAFKEKGTEVRPA
jgi:HSP90 family molecular chaperone